ncbi:MAG TPA: CoA ester lyase [Alphaproteobacteria bacterium]|nr:CoA ester lyase [Alphaproteobacteria bacterium]
MLNRSLLFVPALRPERVAKAVAAGADIVCIDLEDSVAPERKAEARDLAVASLRAPPARATLAVRINPIRGEEGPRDAAALAAAGRKPAFVMLPKIEGVEDVAEAGQRLGAAAAPIIAIIETALGLENATAIARAVAPDGLLFFGAMDLSAELGCALEWEPLIYARGRVIQAAACAGIDAMDTPYPDIADEAGGIAEAKRARSFGFTGKAAIHPKHIAGIHATFTPSVAEIAWAKRVREAIGASSGVLQLDGKMIDRPVARAAERVLGIAQRLGL